MRAPFLAMLLLEVAALRLLFEDAAVEDAAVVFVLPFLAMIL